MGMRISRGFCPMPYTYIIISLIYTLIGYEPGIYALHPYNNKLNTYFNKSSSRICERGCERKRQGGSEPALTADSTLSKL